MRKFLAALPHTESKRLRLLLSVLLCLSLCSCANDIEKIRFFDKQQLPSQTVKDATVRRSSSGNVQMIMTTSLVEKYDEPAKRTVYPQGLQVEFLNTDGTKRAFLWTLKAEELTDNNLVQARDSVIIIDFESGDTVYMKNLTWNRTEGRMYSNDLIRSVNGQRLTYGDGFESDEQFNNPQIFHQRGTIEWNEAERQTNEKQD